MNISNLEVCCLAYDKKFDQLKALIANDPDCLKKKDRVSWLIFMELICHRLNFRMVELFYIGRVAVEQRRL